MCLLKKIYDLFYWLILWLLIAIKDEFLTFALLTQQTGPELLLSILTVGRVGENWTGLVKFGQKSSIKVANSNCLKSQ